MSVTDASTMNAAEVVACAGRGMVVHVVQPSRSHVYIHKPKHGKRFDVVWLNRHRAFYHRESPDPFLVRAIVQRADSIEVGPSHELWPEKQAELYSR